MGVKNGSLGIVENVTSARVAVMLDDAGKRIDAIISRARTSVEQDRELMKNRIAFAVAGMVLFAILPGAVARSLPGSWGVPERMAARMVGTDMWNAGQRIMAKADPEQWSRIVAREREQVPPAAK